MTVAAPRVTVVLIFLDGLPFLAEAIASVRTQSYDAWELVLVDDGSNDGSTEVALAAAAEDPGRVRYLEHTGHRNRGPSASRNAGAAAGAGEYVAFLDADDVWLPGKLAHQVQALDREHEAAMTYGRSLYWSSWAGGETNEDYVPDPGIEPETLVAPPLLLTLALESTAPTPGPSDILVRRAAFESVGGFEEGASLGIFEDQAFLAKLYVDRRVYVSGELLDRYRLHDSSFVARTVAAGEKHRIGLTYFDWLERYLREHDVSDKRLWRALRAKRRRYRHPALHALTRRARARAARIHG
jgi:glycosyltransferase involved in cell wall biosynthesis